MDERDVIHGTSRISTTGAPGRHANTGATAGTMAGPETSVIASAFALQATTGVGAGCNVAGDIVIVVDSGCSSAPIVSDRAFLRDVRPCSMQLQAAETVLYTPKESALLHGQKIDGHFIHITLENAVRVPEMNGIDIISSTAASKRRGGAACDHYDGPCLFDIGETFKLPLHQSAGHSCLVSLHMNSKTAMGPVPRRSRTFTRRSGCAVNGGPLFGPRHRGYMLMRQ